MVYNQSTNLIIEGNNIVSPAMRGIYCGPDSINPKKIIANVLEDIPLDGIHDEANRTVVANNTVHGAKVCYTLTNLIFINDLGKNYSDAYSNIRGIADTSLD